MLKRIDRILLRVPQLEAAVTYYRGVLGLTLVRHAGSVASFKLGAGDTELVLHDDPDLPADAVYYLVDNVREMYEQREKLRLKFASAPVQVSKGFRATAKDPFGNVLLLLDRSTESSSAKHDIEDAKAPGALFAGIEQKVTSKPEELAAIYQSIGRTADDLPYTPQFETLYSTYVATLGAKPARQEVWRHLLNMRKAGKLPKLGEARSRPPKVDPEHAELLRELLGPDIGKRDRLPYTERFDQVVNDFNKSQQRRLSPHLVWRIVARLAK